MTIINKTFAIGDTYRGTRGDLFTVTVTLTHEGGKAYELDLSHAQRLLLTKC